MLITGCRPFERNTFDRPGEWDVLVFNADEMGSEMLSSCGDIKVEHSPKRLGRRGVRIAVFRA